MRWQNLLKGRDPEASAHNWLQIWDAGQFRYGHGETEQVRMIKNQQKKKKIKIKRKRKKEKRKEREKSQGKTGILLCSEATSPFSRVRDGMFALETEKMCRNWQMGITSLWTH